MRRFALVHLMRIVSASAFLLSACTTTPQQATEAVTDTGGAKSSLGTNSQAGPANVSSKVTLKGGELKVHVIDVGQGNCIFIECPQDPKLPNSPQILNDCGTVNYGKKNAPAIKQYIQTLVGSRTNLTLFASHGDKDHLSLIYDKQNGVPPGEVSAVYYGGLQSSYPQPFLDWEKGLRSGTPVTGFKWPDQKPNMGLCGNATVEILMVNATAYPNPNRNPNPTRLNKNGDSLVLRVTFNSRSIIVAGDGDEVTQYALMKAYPSGLSPDVLLGLHHGADSYESNSKGWANYARPSIVLFSAGDHDGYRHPRCEAVANYMSSPRIGWEQGKPPLERNLSCGSDKQYGCGGGKWCTIPVNRTIYSTNQMGTLIVRVDASGNLAVLTEDGKTIVNSPASETS